MKDVLAIEKRKLTRSINIGEEYYINALAMDLIVTINDERFIYSTKDMPLVYERGNFVYNSNMLSINSEYYENNKDKLKEYIIEIIRRSKDDTFFIFSTKLIDKDVLQAIADNHNLKYIYLGLEDDIYYLDQDTCDILDNGVIQKVYTKGINKELRDDFRPLIGFNWNRKLLFNQNWRDLQADTIYVSQLVDNENRDNVKYIRKDAKLVINVDDYKQLMPIIDRIPNKVLINVNDKNKFNSYIFKHLNYVKDNIEIRSINDGYTVLPLKEYVRYEKRLYDMIAPAINLSPLEKYLYAYNVVKKFKEYKENHEDKMLARDLYKILDNEFMVCKGYINLLVDLLTKLGMEEAAYGITVDTTFDNVSQEAEYTTDDLVNQSSGHARLLLNIVDPKYGLDGYYFADPTWDKDLKYDFYNHALMTADEFVELNRYSYYSFTVHELLFCKSLEEFYKMINFLMDKTKERFNLYKNESDIINGLLTILKDIDKEFYKEFVSKFDYLHLKSEEIGDALLMLGERIISKNNNQVKASTMKDVIEYLYKDVYQYPDYEERLQETLNDNRKKQEDAAYTRYKIDREGNKTPYLNENNKWEELNDIIKIS